MRKIKDWADPSNALDAHTIKSIRDDCDGWMWFEDERSPLRESFAVVLRLVDQAQSATGNLGLELALRAGMKYAAILAWESAPKGKGKRMSSEYRFLCQAYNQLFDQLGKEPNQKEVFRLGAELCTQAGERSRLSLGTLRNNYKTRIAIRKVSR